MDDVPDDFKLWAIQRGRDIVLREGAELALSARELDEAAITANSTLLAAAIAEAMIDVYRDYVLV